MTQDETIDSPQIKEVLKALNHVKRRDILIYLKDLSRLTSFSELMDYLGIDPKTSGQFSYHLKLLLNAQLITKEDDKYRISSLGVKACSMLDLVDTSEHQESIVQKIANSYRNITPLDQVIISFEAFALILFFIPLIYIIENPNLLSKFIIPFFLGIILFVLLTYYSYIKLKYIPSIFVLISIIWIIFLQSNQIKTGFVYIISVFGIIFILQSLKISNSSNYLLIDLFAGIICLFLSIATSGYIIYKEYWEKNTNLKF